MIDKPISGQFLQDHFLQYTQQIRISPDFNHTAWFWNFNYWTVWGRVPVACDMEEHEPDGHLSFQTTILYIFIWAPFQTPFPDASLSVQCNSQFL